MRETSGVRTAGLYFNCRGKPLSKGVMGYWLLLQVVPLSRKSVCPGLPRHTPGLCLLPGVIIYSASFCFQKCAGSDTKSQDPPDSGHSKEKVRGRSSWKL